jgi:hypothetical protein
MSGTYELFVLQRQPLPADRALRTAHETMVAHGAELTDECVYILELADDEDSDPEPVTDVDAALGAMASTPGLGLIQYDFAGVYLDTSFLSAALDGTMDGVELSVGQLTFERQGDAFAAKLLELGRALHEALGGARTVMDWGLTDHGFDWRDELGRVRAGQYSGSFALLDVPAR